MADFSSAFEYVIEAEGGFVLTNDPADKGGMTYAGISRRAWPSCEGWAFIDRGEKVPEQLVSNFYKSKFWDQINGDEIRSQSIATAIFSFAVNAGIKRAVKIAQNACGAVTDGILGIKTLALLNSVNPDLFLAKFALSKIAFYRDICQVDASQKRFILGWISRAIKESAC